MSGNADTIREYIRSGIYRADGAFASLAALDALVAEIQRLRDALEAADKWLNTPQDSGGGHIAVHAHLCHELAAQIRVALASAPSEDTE
jgi:hypothetical protein